MDWNKERIDDAEYNTRQKRHERAKLRYALEDLRMTLQLWLAVTK